VGEVIDILPAPDGLFVVCDGSLVSLDEAGDMRRLDVLARPNLLMPAFRRPDGSALMQLTETKVGTQWYPEWSFDGSRIMTAGVPVTRVLDPAKPIAERVVLELPSLPDGTSFHGVTWSGDGKRLAGMEVRSDGSSAGIWLYHLDSGRYERVTTRGRIPHLLADGRRLVYNDEGLLRFLDTASGRSEELISVGWSNQVNNREFKVARDGRQIVFVRAENEADIWLMSPE